MKSKEYLTTSYYTLRIMNPATNKKARCMIECYNNWKEGSTITSLYAKKPCSTSIEAYDAIRQQMFADGGKDFRCGNPTCYSWCCAYIITVRTNHSYLIYHTRDHVYCVQM